MAGMVLFDQELVPWLTFKLTRLDTYYLGLFVNSHVPAHGDTESSYTEATFGGYARQALTSWGTPTFDSGNDWAITSDVAHTFSVTSSPFDQIVYGYVIYDGSGPSAKAVGAMADPGGGFPMSAVGRSYVVTPSWIEQSKYM